jgi:hypothetical protein
LKNTEIRAKEKGRKALVSCKQIHYAIIFFDRDYSGGCFVPQHRAIRYKPAVPLTQFYQNLLGLAEVVSAKAGFSLLSLPQYS